MVWVCVLTFEAEQGTQSLEALSSPREPRTCQSAHPRLQKMLRAHTMAAPSLEGQGPPAPAPPERPQAVEESPWASAQPKRGKPPTGPNKPPKQEPGLESKPDQGGASGPYRRREQTPRRGLEASAADLSPWGGTNWGGSSANSSWSRSSWNRQGRSWKDRSPSRSHKAASQASGSQAESETAPKQRKRPHSTRRQSKAPKFRDMSQIEAAWEGAKPELCAVQPHATFYEDAPPHQKGIPRGKFNLSGLKISRETIDGERRVLLSIPAEVAEL
eukprot:528930-Amphidinium_carterae.1